jgi:hypothetical protein
MLQLDNTMPTRAVELQSAPVKIGASSSKKSCKQKCQLVKKVLGERAGDIAQSYSTFLTWYKALGSILIYVCQTPFIYVCDFQKITKIHLLKIDLLWT